MRCLIAAVATLIAPLSAQTIHIVDIGIMPAIEIRHLSHALPAGVPPGTVLVYQGATLIGSQIDITQPAFIVRQ